MRLRKRKSSFEDSSALSDLAFLLIIYFIVIAGFNVNKGFLLNLPEKNSTRLVRKDDVLRYELDDGGILRTGGSQGALTGQLPLAEAEAQIRSAMQKNPNLALMLTVAPNCPWQSVVSFVELARKIDVDSFSFSMKTSAGETP